MGPLPLLMAAVGWKAGRAASEPRQHGVLRPEEAPRQARAVVHVEHPGHAMQIQRRRPAIKRRPARPGYLLAANIAGESRGCATGAARPPRQAASWRRIAVSDGLRQRRA